MSGLPSSSKSGRGGFAKIPQICPGCTSLTLKKRQKKLHAWNFYTRYHDGTRCRFPNGRQIREDLIPHAPKIPSTDCLKEELAPAGFSTRTLTHCPVFRKAADRDASLSEDDIVATCNNDKYQAGSRQKYPKGNQKKLQNLFLALQKAFRKISSLDDKISDLGFSQMECTQS